MNRQRRASTSALASPSGGAALQPLSESHGSAGLFSQAGRSALSPMPLSKAEGSSNSLAVPGAPSPGSQKDFSRRASFAIGQSGSSPFGTLGKTLGGLKEENEEEEVTVESASAALIAAMMKNDVGALLTAVGQCRSAGVERSLIEEGTRSLQRIEAQGSLKRAMQEESILVLDEALRKATKFGLDAGDTKEAKDFMIVLQAEERLQTAIGMKEANAINWCLDHAVEGVRDKKLHEANAVLVQIEKISKLKAAIRGKKTSDIKDVLQSLGSGFTGPVADEARHILEVEKKHAAGARRASVAKAEEESGNKEADMLAAAVTMRDASSLRMALRMAKDAGMSKGARSAAQKVLDQLEALAAVEKAMKEALKSKEIKKVKEALIAAEVTGLDPESKEFEGARKLISQIEVTKELEDAVKSRKPAELQEAIGRARSGGVAGMPLEKAERILAQVEAAPEASSSTPTSNKGGRRKSVEKAAK